MMPADTDVTSKLFHSFVKENFPEMIVLGPADRRRRLVSDLLVASGPGGRGSVFVSSLWNACRSDAALRVRGRPLFRRCGCPGRIRPWLSIRSLADQVRSRQADLADRDRGGSVRRKPLGATFLDTFRYLDQLGRLRRPAFRS